MTRAIELLSLPGVIFLAIALAAVLILLVRVVWWWVTNVAQHRIPRPFLGEGANVEWAELKRAELEAGGLALEPKDLSVSDFDSESIGRSRGRTSSLGSRSNANGNDSGQQFENIMSQERLLQAWLSETGHTDDEWAEKLLGDSRKSE